jgi:hypothetical protein
MLEDIRSCIVLGKLEELFDCASGSATDEAAGRSKATDLADMLDRVRLG